MDKLIPDYLKNDVVSFSIQDGIVSGDNGVDVVILKNNGELIELSSGAVLSSVKLTSRADCAKKITTYYNGEMKKYYLVWIGGSLYVVEKNKKLSLHKIVENVRDLKLADYHRTGYPQVVLKTDSRNEPLILDFQTRVSDRSEYLPVLVKDCLFVQVQSIKLEIEKAKRYLEKRKNLTSRVIANIDSEFFESSDKMQTDVYALSVTGNPYVLLLNDILIIGIEVYNSFTTEISQVEIQLLSPTKSCRSVILLKKNYTDCTDVEDFQISHLLPAESSGYLIGTLEDVEFCVTEILFIGTLSYAISGKAEVHCIQLNFNPVNLMEQLRISSHDLMKSSENKIIMGLIATAVKQVINIEFFDYCCFPDIFARMGFQKLCKNYVLYPIWSSNFLKGMLIKICELNEPDSCKVSLRIYGRDNAQLDMFNRLFYGNIQDENVLRFSKKENVLFALDQILEEIKCIKTLLFSYKPKENAKFKLNYLKFLECEKNANVIIDDYDKERYNALKYINV